MAKMNRPQGQLTRILGCAADRMAGAMAVPEETRQAFREQFVSIVERAIFDAIGADSLCIRGWAIVPSERRERRARIVDAIERGDANGDIASRELVSVSWVARLRRDMAGL